MQAVEKRQSLTREQKEAVGLLSIGTFLEFFDLMLFVHMAVLLNELFFPKTDPFTASLLAAFAFCSIYVFRPFSALLFGWIGDNIGRKTVVIISTLFMGLSCFVMANLPTYDQIGLTASVIMIICRAVQGISSMGEIIGGEIYLTEITKPPTQYSIVSLLAFSAAAGSTAALGIATLTTSLDFNWRMGFWFGAGVAMVGVVARTTLKETKEFVDAKFKLNEILSSNNVSTNLLKKDPFLNKSIPKLTVLAYFLMHCGWPVCFYLAYIHCGNILINHFSYTPEQVIHHNAIVSIPQLLAALLLRVYLSNKVYPLKILKVILVCFSVFIVLFPYILSNTHSTYIILICQMFIMVFALDVMPAVPILYSHFPILKRFSYASVTYAISRALIYIITSFGFAYTTKYFNNYGILIIVIPVIVGYTLGMLHFNKLELGDGSLKSQ